MKKFNLPNNNTPFKTFLWRAVDGWELTFTTASPDSDLSDDLTLPSIWISNTTCYIGNMFSSFGINFKNLV